MPWGSWASGSDSTRSAAGVHGNPGLGKAVGVCGGLGEAAGACGGLEKAAGVRGRLEKAAGVCTGDVKTVAKSPSSMSIKWVLEPWRPTGVRN